MRMNRNCQLGCVLVVGFFLSACSDQEFFKEQAAELNARIDALEAGKKESSAKEATLLDLERKVTELEEDQKYKIKNFVRREDFALKRIASIEADMSEKLAQIKILEERVKKYEKSTEERRAEIDARLSKLVKDLEAEIDLSPAAGEKKVVLLERLLKVIQSLKEENDTLRAAIGKKANSKGKEPAKSTPP